MRRIWTAIFGVGLVGFVAIQFIRPEISHAPVTADLVAPPEVKQILKNSCYDCHSNETKLAWFDEIVPGYWLVARDVKDARSHLNFSEFGKLPAGQQKGALYEAVNQVQLGAMPLPAYKRLHRDAVVTAAELMVLKNYLNPGMALSAAAAGDLALDDAQYQKWIRDGSSARAVATAPNGIEFPAGYKNWKAISSTDRFDNQSLRVILGNDIAIQAIAENRIKPWPDGSTFAKVAWLAREDGQGHVASGTFFQVEFMIRDGKKYAGTEGWGWARWRGAGLTPYGKDAGFSAECTGCHAPLRDNDYVYTLPLPAASPGSGSGSSDRVPSSINEGAALTGSLPWNPLQWNVITSFTDKPASTMSTLYGNDAAVRYARSNSQPDYPAGAVLSLVTWTQQEDPHWFGARIPRQVKAVEFVSVTAGTNNQPWYSYQGYEGSPLRKASASEGLSPGSRTAYLLSQRAAVMP
jgi:hypothetical protein